MRLTQKAEAMLDLPGGALSGEARMEIVGKSSVAIDGSCDILEYEPTCVRLSTRSGELRISGDELVLKNWHAQGAFISGRLLSVEFL